MCDAKAHTLNVEHPSCVTCCSKRTCSQTTSLAGLYKKYHICCYKSIPLFFYDGRTVADRCASVSLDLREIRGLPRVVSSSGRIHCEPYHAALRLSSHESCAWAERRSEAHDSREPLPKRNCRPAHRTSGWIGDPSGLPCGRTGSFCNPPFHRRQGGPISAGPRRAVCTAHPAQTATRHHSTIPPFHSSPDTRARYHRDARAGRPRHESSQSHCMGK